MYRFFQGRLIIVRLIMLTAALTLIAVGIVTIYAVDHPAEADTASGTSPKTGFWEKQIRFAILAIIAFLAVNTINYCRLGTMSYWIYAAVLVMLGVLLLGKFINLPFVPMINGTHRWIRFTIAGRNLPALQPSEFCKLAYVLSLAWYLRYRSNYRQFTTLIGPFALTILPMAMILFEPDLGTVLLMPPVLFAMLFVAGAKVKHLLIIIVMALLLSPLFWRHMNHYQRIRISSVLLQNKLVQQQAEKHPTLGKLLVGREFTTKQWKNNWGYHLIRSKYAVASGGLTGYGYGKGPFVKYNFLPERHNDFIFATIAHQWGFFGCLGILALYAVIITCGLEIASSNIDPFGRLLAVGIVAMFAVEVLVNVSMTLGLMPITGLTLPLVSYGGSSLLVSMAALGLLNNVGRCRPFSMARQR